MYPFHLPKSMRNQSGMSLISVMVAVGVAGVLVMFIAQLFQQIQSVAFYANAQAELQDGIGTLALELSKNDNCSCNLKNKSFASNPGTVTLQSVDLTQLDAYEDTCLNPKPIVVKGQEIHGVKRLGVNSLKLGNFKPLGTASPPTSYVGEIQVGFLAGSNLLGIPPMMRKIPVELNVTDPGGTATIQSCSVVGKTSGGGSSATNLKEFFEAMAGKRIGAFQCAPDNSGVRCDDDTVGVGLIFDYESDGVIIRVRKFMCSNSVCNPLSAANIDYPKVTVQAIENRSFAVGPGNKSPTLLFDITMDPRLGGQLSLVGFYNNIGWSCIYGSGDSAPPSPSWLTSWLMSPLHTNPFPPIPEAGGHMTPIIKALFPGVTSHLSTRQNDACYVPPPSGGGA